MATRAPALQSKFAATKSLTEELPLRPRFTIYDISIDFTLGRLR